MVLTIQNLQERVLNWRKFNCKHLGVVSFDDDLFHMLKTKKYYLAAHWVIGGYGKGYNPVRMQSLYRMMVILE